MVIIYVENLRVCVGKIKYIFIYVKFRRKKKWKYCILTNGVEFLPIYEFIVRIFVQLRSKSVYVLSVIYYVQRVSFLRLSPSTVYSALR